VVCCVTAAEALQGVFCTEKLSTPATSSGMGPEAGLGAVINTCIAATPFAHHEDIRPLVPAGAVSSCWHYRALQHNCSASSAAAVHILCLLSILADVSTWQHSNCLLLPRHMRKQGVSLHIRLLGRSNETASFPKQPGPQLLGSVRVAAALMRCTESVALTSSTKSAKATSRPARFHCAEKMSPEVLQECKHNTRSLGDEPIL
jgi:hypothetical protein